MEKMTNVKAIEYVVATYGEELPSEVVEKLEKIKASFEKKSTSKKPTATQVANEDYKEAIVNALTEAGKALTIQDIQTACGGEVADFSTSKMSALLAQLRKDGTVVRTYDKKKAYFSVVA
jgi:predicted Zn-ribbon and HTH transcriptional regulator